MPKRPREGQDQQSRRFVDAARELGVDETKAGQERAFVKVGLKSRDKNKKKKSQITDK